MSQLLPDPSVWILLVLDGVLLKIRSVLPNVLLLYPTTYIAYPPASLHKVVKVLPVIDVSPLFTNVSLYSLVLPTLLKLQAAETVTEALTESLQVT